jgi:hypothetical protein
MAKPAISRIRDCIRSQNYAVSIHASEELDDDITARTTQMATKPNNQNKP